MKTSCSWGQPKVTSAEVTIRWKCGAEKPWEGDPGRESWLSQLPQLDFVGCVSPPFDGICLLFVFEGSDTALLGTLGNSSLLPPWALSVWRMF